MADALPDLLNTNPGERWRLFPLSGVFTDPDGDELTWSVSSANTAVAEAGISADSVIVNTVAVGSTTVTVTATDPDGLFANDVFTVEVVEPPPPALFDIDLYFTGDVTSAQRTVMRNARDRWESILGGTELGDVALTPPVECADLSHPTLNSVDDHAIFVDIASIDGPGGSLAYGGYCLTRISDGIPAVSVAVFDEDDIGRISAAGSLEDLAFHEFAHGLGFLGDYFEDHNLLNTGSDPHFSGSLAIAAFNSAGGSSYTGAKVPLSSPDHNHWRESVLGREGMTTVFTVGGTNPFSAITLQAMADLGYVVDVSLADAYQLPGTPPPDVAGEVFDLSNDVLRGPVAVVDADGRIVRVIPPPPGTVLPSFPRKEVGIDRRERGRPGIWSRSPSR